jgi:translin
MNNLDTILQSIDGRFAEKNAVREAALAESRRVIQQAAKVVKAIHRREWNEAEALLGEATTLAATMSEKTLAVPELYWTGYVLDAQKEYAEAHLLFVMVRGGDLPTPESLGVEDAVYLNGLAEAASELRRFILDLVRHNDFDAAENLIGVMEDTYAALMTIDYPHALTNNLRRTLDVLRPVLERTRGDLTVAMKQQSLKDALDRMAGLLGKENR